MKIVAGKYPEEKNIDKWVGFLGNGNVNIVMLWRYAAYCRDIIKAKNIVDVGLRDTAEQKRLYDLYKAGKGDIAAAPGTSWHEYGFAMDLNRYKTNPDGTGQYYGTINADYTNWLNGKPEVLNKYGLMHAVKGEIWHIQPIETKGVSDEKGFADKDDYLRNDYKLPVVAINPKDTYVIALEGSVNTLTAQVGSLNTKILSLDKDLAEAELKVVEFANQIDTLKNNLKAEVVKNSNHISDVIKLSQEITMLKNDISKKDKEISALNVKLAEKPLEVIKCDLSGATVGELVGAIWNKFKGIK